MSLGNKVYANTQQKKMNKISQKQLAFYLLYRGYKEHPTEFIPTWRFVGEIDVKELNRWEMASYKCPARLSDIMQENPNLLEREMVTGKSGAKYYQYRIRDGMRSEDIKDPSLIAFRKSLQ